MKRVALVGMPNTGKSTLFNRLTGARARIGNWPGLTVDLMSARILLGADMVEVVDLPGIYDLTGFSEDEDVVRRFLQSQPTDLILAVANAAQLDRQSALTVQLAGLGVPMLIVLNMSDEARHLGIEVDCDAMARLLEHPVVPVSARLGQDIDRVTERIIEQLRHSTPRTVPAAAFVGHDDMEARADTLLDHAVRMPVQLTHELTERLDRVLVHKWAGLPLFFLTMYLLFEAVYTLGTPMQETMAWLFETAKTRWVVELLGWMPETWYSFLVEGIYEGVGTVLSFMPIIVLFFLGIGIVESSGYLSRAAFLMDAFMVRLGLDGRSFVMQLMGFGCNVPALMGTRVMRSRSLRLLTMLIIPFSLCSARLQVFVFLTTAVFSPRSAPIVLFSLYVMSFAAAFLTATLYRRRLPNTEPLLLELPPYRFPTAGQVAARGWEEARRFIRDASGFILLGVIAVWFVTHYPFGQTVAGAETLAGRIAHWLNPLLAPLGIDELMSVALLFGFVAKEVVIGALAVIYGAGDQSLPGMIADRYNWIQAYSFMLFVLIYTPCLSTVAVLKQESRSWRFTAVSVLWPLFLAWSASFIFYQVATRLSA